MASVTLRKGNARTGRIRRRSYCNQPARSAALKTWSYHCHAPTSAAIYEQLENPAVLNTLRGGKFALDMAAIDGTLAARDHLARFHPCAAGRVADAMTGHRRLGVRVSATGPATHPGRRRPAGCARSDVDARRGPVCLMEGDRPSGLISLHRPPPHMLQRNARRCNESIETAQVLILWPGGTD